MPPIKKQKVVKKRGQNLYFHQGTQAAIVTYQTTTDAKAREQIYLAEILPVFNTLTENLIFMHGFAKGTDFEALRNDCVVHLYETLGKFNPTRGTKAFSYFNVVAKHYLIIQSKKRKKHQQRFISLDDQATMNYAEQQMVESGKSADSPDKALMSKDRSIEILRLLQEIRGRITSDIEISCLDAIVKVFESIDDLDFLNKRAIFVYIREISGCSPKQLSIAMSSIRKHYKELARSDEFELF